MKKTVLFLITSLVFVTMMPSVLAQNSPAEKDIKFTIKTNPLAALGGPFWIAFIPITGEYKLLFETVVSEKSSFQVGAGYLGPSVLLNLDELTSEGNSVSGIKTSGFRIQGMYKLFISRDLTAPEGFYVGPHISFGSVQIKNKENTSDYLKGTKLNINGIFGYQLITSGGFTLDLFTGMGFVSRNWNTSGEEWDPDTFLNKNSISIPFGFSFGYAF